MLFGEKEKLEEREYCRVALKRLSEYKGEDET